MGESRLAQLLLLDKLTGLSMRGSVASRQVCPLCGAKGKFTEIHGRALVCQCGGFAASKLHVLIRWQGKLYRINRDQAGRELTDFPHAERALGEINNQVERNLFDPALWSTKTNKLLWQNYLADYLKREQMRCTQATYQRKRALCRHFAWFNDRLITEIRTAHVQDYAALPCLELSLAPKTRADLLSELRSIFTNAVEREELERAPLVPKVAVPEKAIEWLSPEEQTLAMNHIPERHRPIFRFLMQYGCRVAEACALCWDKIDRRKETLYIARTFSRRHLATTTKTRRERALPIFDAMNGYLGTIPQGVGKTPVFKNPDADITRNKEAFYIPDFLNTIWRRACQEASLPPIALKNATRHSRGMQAMNLDDWPEEDVALLFGHTSRQHTKKYARPELSRLKRRMDGQGVSTGKVATLLPPKNGNKSN